MAPDRVPDLPVVADSCQMVTAGHATGPWSPDPALHALVAAHEAGLVPEVLPDALRAQPGDRLGFDDRPQRIGLTVSRTEASHGPSLARALGLLRVSSAVHTISSFHLTGRRQLRWRTESSPSIASYGIGCPGPLGVPTVTLSTPPVQGSTVTPSVTNAYAAPASAIALLGLDPANLPIPGTACSLLVASPLTFALGPISAGGSFSRALAVPCESQLCGLDVYLQVFELAPMGFGLAATPGLQAVIGS